METYQPITVSLIRVDLATSQTLVKRINNRATTNKIRNSVFSIYDLNIKFRY